ncbi:hypothetical protein [Microbacterium karelineae]|uniref:hypothetical protein n=1 Tax=Microbacterium karelineae TaxID=2654283 RepID=UPI0012EB0117|nr:hypothetical protein [Microbacterium karelineae]
MPTIFVVPTGLEETPVPTPTVDPDSVTPGPMGFLVVALLVVVVVLLVLDMLRRVRRVRYRAEVQEMLDAEEAAAQADDGGDTRIADEDADDADPGSTTPR